MLSYDACVLCLQAPLALFFYGPWLILFGFAYALHHGLDAEHVAELYARHHVALIYHAGVISCHFANYYVSHNLELISKRLQPTGATAASEGTSRSWRDKLLLHAARGG